MLCKNTGNSDAEFSIDGHPGHPSRQYKIKPGETVDIPDGYCKPYKSDTQRTLPPVITQLHKNMKPLGERAKGQLPTTAAVGEQVGAGNDAILAAIGRLDAKVTGLETENRALRRENMSLRRTLPDQGAAVDEKNAADDAGEGDNVTADDKPARARKAG